MKISRWFSIPLLLLSAAFSILGGSSLARTKSGTPDFKAVYYGTRCLLQHHNPYNVGELERVVWDEHGERPLATLDQHQAVTLYVNLPTTFLFIAPFAALPFAAAQTLWLVLLAALLLLVGFAMWNLSESFAPTVSLFLICIVLANSLIIFSGGNTAGIAVSFCLLAVWCFHRERFVTVGIFCMALSLAIKPHDSGFVWLYFLLVGGVYRKRAIQSLLVTVALGILAFIWVSQVAPHWMQDWHTNMSAISTHGYINDPGPASIVGFRTLGPVIDLQSVISVFRDDPRTYNTVTYLICGPMLFLWAIATLRSPFSKGKVWLALAAIAPLTMLVTYHRPWDAKLLLLTVPACAMLWAEGGAKRWLAFVFSTATLVAVGDIPMVVYLSYGGNTPESVTGLSAQIVTILMGRQIPLLMLIMGVFYLWVYVRRAFSPSSSKELGEYRQKRSIPATVLTGSSH